MVNYSQWESSLWSGLYTFPLFWGIVFGTNLASGCEGSYRLNMHFQ